MQRMPVDLGFDAVRRQCGSQSRWDPFAVKLLGYKPWVAPNSTGYVDRLGPHQNYSGYWNYGRSFAREDEKIDQIFSAKNRMFGRYSRQMDISSNTTGTLTVGNRRGAKPEQRAIHNLVVPTRMSSVQPC